MKRKITIALSGNPNSGKTTVFNAITGARQHIANYPGVTVEKKYGKIKHQGYDIEVVDLPGTYSLTAYSLEEIVARDFLVNEKPDVVVDIVDASNLDRNLYLAVQFKELGVPLIIALNMVDVAKARGIMVDQETLSTLLGIPVVPTVARSNKGIYELLDKAIEVALNGQEWRPVIISYGTDIDQGLNEIEDIIKGTDTYDKRYHPRWLALKCMEKDTQIVELIRGDHEISSAVEAICNKTSKHIMDTLEEEPEGIIAEHRYGHIAGITKRAVKRRIESRLNVSDRIDKVLTNRIIGPLVMLAILYGIYEFTFWVSEGPLGWLEVFFGWLKGMVSHTIPAGILYSLIVSGIIDGVGGILGFIPLIMFMFFAIAIMEDSGYMARVAYMLDRLLRWFGLHGNSVMALIVSGGIAGGCAVPGVMATRTLRDPKERIATLLVVPFMNCGAKLPVFAMLIAAFFVKNEARMMFIFTLLAWSFALFAAKIIRSTVLKGPKTPFVMELPPYRLPTLKGLIIHTWERTWQFIKRAGTFILGMSILLWAMMTFPGLSEKQTKAYEEQRVGLRNAFLALPEVKTMIKDEKGLEDLDELANSYSQTMREEGTTTEMFEKNPLFPLVKGIFSETDAQKEGEENHLIPMKVASAYLRYKEELAQIDGQQNQATLKGTIAGRVGQILERITFAVGFDYRTNIALIGGFAAKEVVVSTLGTAYSLGEVEPEQSRSISEKMREDPQWNPLVAFTLILFTMLYVPCMATVISIKKESSWRWAGFSVAFNLIAAYLVCLLVYQVGSAIGLGG
ncbi:MAG: ferrous iron transport protein B [Deltaproteobacteria bacterium]|nr:MAG: ferrous iron transport protein B [Deltaproteobacteria bacterium]